jgi:arginine decarboxylase
VLDALADYHRLDRYGFSPPGHRQGRGVDERVRAVLGREPFRDDVIASGGLADWCSTGDHLAQAEKLMADAVGSSSAFISTCGSSLSVRAAMMAVAACFFPGTATSRSSAD